LDRLNHEECEAHEEKREILADPAKAEPRSLDEMLCRSINTGIFGGYAMQANVYAVLDVGIA